MSFRLSRRKVISSLIDNVTCNHEIDAATQIEVRVSYLNCNKQKPTTLYSLQNSGRNFKFTDVEEIVDYSTASEITFGVWDSVDAGSTQHFSKSLGSGTVVVNENTVLVIVEDSDMNIPSGRLWWELWATVAGDNRTVGRGYFMVQDTRKYD